MSIATCSLQQDVLLIECFTEKSTLFPHCFQSQIVVRHGLSWNESHYILLATMHTWWWGAFFACCSINSDVTTLISTRRWFVRSTPFSRKSTNKRTLPPNKNTSISWRNCYIGLPKKMYNKNRRAKYGYLFVQWGKVNEKARKRESEKARKFGPRSGL